MTSPANDTTAPAAPSAAGTTPTRRDPPAGRRRYRLRAELLSGVVVKRDRHSQRSEGVSSIAGSLLRGALAQAYVQQHGSADATFRRLFLDEAACRFGPLAPAPGAVPLTAVSCKRRPGFLADGKDGVADLLWARAAQAVGAVLPEDTFRCQGRRNGVPCGHDLKPYTGFYSADGTSAARAAGVPHGVAAHVGIDRATGAAAESIFYTMEAMAAKTVGGDPVSLVGWVEADAASAAALDDLLTAEAGEVYVGHARTRGYGRVRLVKLDPDPAYAPPDGAARFDGWEKNKTH